MKTIFKTAHELVHNENITWDTLDLSMADVHHKGLYSIVIGGTEHGELTRVFIATEKIEPYALKLHSHTYDLRLGVIKGVFQHFQAVECGEGAKGPGSVYLDKYEYKSPLNGGNGLKYIKRAPYSIMNHYVPPGGEVFFDSSIIHTVAVEAGTMWIIKECGKKTETSIVLGEKFTTENLYTKLNRLELDRWFWRARFALDEMMEK